MIKYTVDVIIPTYKPNDDFYVVINRLLAQTYTVRRIIIMNTEADYIDEERLLEKSNNIEIYNITKKEFDHGGTRHEGALKADGDLMLFLTQDVMIASTHLVEYMVEAFIRDEMVAAAYGRQIAKRNSSDIEVFSRRFNYPNKSFVKSLADIEWLGIKTYFCSNVCAMYRRNVYMELGGFPKKAIFNEDMIYTAGLMKAGYKVAYVAEAKVFHSHDYTAMQQFRRNFDLAVSQKQHPEVFESIKSESEGIKLVKDTARYLKARKKSYMIPHLIWISGFKFMGYQLGKRYNLLSKNMIYKCSMNKEYWATTEKI